MATITALGFRISTSYDGDGLRRARRDMDDFDNSTTKNTNSLNSWSGRIALMARAAIGLGPALVPIGAGLISVGASAGAMATSTGVAMGAFGLGIKAAIASTTGLGGETTKLGNQLNQHKAILATLTPGTAAYAAEQKKVAELTKQYNQALSALNPAQRAFVQQQNSMKSAWQDFGTNVSSSVLPPITKLMGAMEVGLKKIEPLIKAMSPLANEVANSISKWITGSGMTNFIQLVQASAIPALKNMWDIAKDVARILSDAFRAFLPDGQRLVGILKEGADNLKKWADGGGFQRFLEYVHQHKDQLEQFFKALGDALGNISKAFSGMGPNALTFTTLMLQLIGAMPPAVIQALAYAWLAWSTAMGIWSIIAPIVTSDLFAVAAAEVAAAWPIWVIIAAVIAVIAIFVALGYGIYELVQHWAGFTHGLVTAWNAVWEAIKIAATVVWAALQVAFDAFISAMTTTWNAVSGALKSAWTTVWNAIKGAAQTVWTALQNAWSTFIGALASTWTTVSGALKSAWTTVWNAMKTAADAVWNAMKTAWSAFINALSSVWTTVSGALKSSWSAVWNALKTAADAVWNAMKTAWSAFTTALNTAWTTVSNALKASWSAVWNAIKTAGQAIWTAMQTAWKAFLTAVQQAWTTVSNALKTAWSAVWNAMKTAAQTIWNAMKTAWTTFLNAIKSAWTTVSNALKAAWSAVWNAMKTAVQAIWDALKTAWSAFLTAIKSAWDTAGAALKKAMEDVWHGIETTAKTVWDNIKKIIGDAVNAVIGIINGIANGIESIAEKVGLHLWGNNPVPKVNFAAGGIVGDVPAFEAGGIVNYAGGGVLGGYEPGVDTVPAMLSKGEGVLVPEAVVGLGPDFVHWANHHFSGGRGGKTGVQAPEYMAGFAQGGLVSLDGGIEAWHRRGPEPGWGFAAGGILPSEIPAPDPNNPGQTSGTVGQTPGKNPGGSGTESGGSGIAGISIPGVGDIGSLVLGFIGKAAIAALINPLLDRLKGFNKAGEVGQIPIAATKKVIQGAIDWLVKKDEAAKKTYESHAVAPSSGGVERWRALAIQAMGMGGIDPLQINAFLQRMAIESGGNPNAINNWDINAKNGIPSQGLMQIIPPNFSKFHVAGTSGNILDPLANMAAAAAYIRAVYGGRVPLGAAYAMGTGGAAEGWHLVGEQGPEVIHARGGERITNNHELRNMIGHGGGHGDVHLSMPIHVEGNMDQAAVDKLDREVLPKLKTLLVKGTGTRY